jgi:hypothetical protein
LLITLYEGFFMYILYVKNCRRFHTPTGGHTFLYVMRYVMILLAHLWKKASRPLRHMRQRAWPSQVQA